jgi:hypothetical protein
MDTTRITAENMRMATNINRQRTDPLKRIGGLFLKVFIILILFLTLKTAPSLLWPKQRKALVQDEGYVEGHYTVGINERALQKATDTLLFSTLKKWRYERERPSPAPQEVSENNNKFVKVTGFMYPLESGPQIANFCLLRSTQTCCYGPRPEYNQYVLVEMDHAVPFERLRPVEVTGIFYIEPKPEEGYIYRMEGKNVAVATR